MKIAVLCNSLMGIPSLQALAQTGRLSALGIPDVAHEATESLRHLAAQLNIPLTVFSKQTFAANAEKWIRDSGAQLVLVYTFPFIVSGEMLKLPSAGFLNFHFGMLPEYRGADAIFWQIRNREPFGAVTVHRMEAALDTGPVCLLEKVPIGPLDTYGIQMGNLALAGMKVTRQLLNLLDGSAGNLNFIPQDESKARVWPKPAPGDVMIDWVNQSAEEILALIRACNPWNKGAYTFIGNSPLRITVAAAAEGKEELAPGTLFESPDGYWLQVACKEGKALRIEVISLDAGFFSGTQLKMLGLAPGMKMVKP